MSIIIVIDKIKEVKMSEYKISKQGLLFICIFMILVISALISLLIVANKLRADIKTFERTVGAMILYKNRQSDEYDTAKLNYYNIDIRKDDNVFLILKKGCKKEFLPKIGIYTLYIHIAGSFYNVNPNLLADIMVLESKCDNIAINKNSRAFGLMQIHPVHNISLYSNDFENILKGGEILRECFDKYKSVVGALECYGRGKYEEDKIVYDGTKLLSGKYKTIE